MWDRRSRYSHDDLERISRVEGASPIEDIDEPGGGKRVRLTDPDGWSRNRSPAWPCST
jgi:hypothetical protein